MIEASGAVLAGGRSSRMGKDKGKILLAGGITMENNAICTLGSSLYGPVFLSGPGGIPDIHPGKGPLGGIEAVLNCTYGSCTVFLPCDMPFVKPFLIHRMLECYFRSPFRPAVAMAPFMEPLFSVVPNFWKERVSNAMQKGHLKVGKFWIDCGFTPVTVSECHLVKDVDHPWEVPA